MNKCTAFSVSIHQLMYLDFIYFLAIVNRTVMNVYEQATLQ